MNFLRAAAIAAVASVFLSCGTQPPTAVEEPSPQPSVPNEPAAGAAAPGPVLLELLDDPLVQGLLESLAAIPAYAYLSELLAPPESRTADAARVLALLRQALAGRGNTVDSEEGISLGYIELLLDGLDKAAAAAVGGPSEAPGSPGPASQGDDDDA